MTAVERDGSDQVTDEKRVVAEVRGRGSWRVWRERARDERADGRPAPPERSHHPV